jgi:hypothetical protein
LRLPKDSGSLDWYLLSNNSSPRQARITVTQCWIGAWKAPVSPGPLLVSLDLGKSTHTANTYREGVAWEGQRDCSSNLLFSDVSVWPGNCGFVNRAPPFTLASFCG